VSSKKTSKIPVRDERGVSQADERAETFKDIVEEESKQREDGTIVDMSFSTECILDTNQPQNDCFSESF
jgi:hypothetical protein